MFGICSNKSGGLNAYPRRKQRGITAFLNRPPYDKYAPRGGELTPKRDKKKYTYGYSIHVNCDEDGFIHKQRTTAGNAHDSQVREELMTGCESELYAYSAYSSAQTNADLADRGVKNNVQKKGQRNHPLNVSDTERNKEIGFTRGRVEAVFGSHKLHRNLRKTRFMGLAKNAAHFAIVAIVYNLQKAAKFVEKYGLLTPQIRPNCA